MLSLKELKRRTDDNEIDLSLSQIKDVPVKDIASIKKVDTIDLSCNLIRHLPEDFCVVLTRLVKLDLSKNKIVELPNNFGLLQQLQHLDLFQNKLRMIPVTFSQLKRLKWLDLKDNPLDASYKKYVGDCLDDKQCKLCAKNVVSAMKTILANNEKKRLKKLEAKKKAQALQKETELAEVKKKENKNEKKKKKKQRAKANQNGTKDENLRQKTDKTPSKSARKKKSASKSSCGFGAFLFSFLVLLIAATIGAYFYCESNRSKDHCVILNEYAKTSSVLLQDWYEKSGIFLGKAADYVGELLIVLKVESSKMLDHVHQYYTNWTKT